MRSLAHHQLRVPFFPFVHEPRGEFTAFLLSSFKRIPCSFNRPRIEGTHVRTGNLLNAHLNS